MAYDSQPSNYGKNKGQSVGFWNKPERVDLLRTLWVDPAYTPLQIAAKLNCTRYAVYNKAASLRLPKRNRLWIGKPKKVALVPPALRKPKPIKDPPRPKVTPAKPVMPVTKAVSLFDRTGCAFPVRRHAGEYLFCNCPTKTGPYCEFHRSIVYKVV